MKCVLRSSRDLPSIAAAFVSRMRASSNAPSASCASASGATPPRADRKRRGCANRFAPGRRTALPPAACFLLPLAVAHRRTVGADQRRISGASGMSARSGRDRLHLGAHIWRDVGHREQQAIAFRDAAARGGCEEQFWQSAFHIGELLAPRKVIDLLLDQGQHRADFEPVGRQEFCQCGGELEFGPVAVRCALARCRRKRQHMFRPVPCGRAPV